MQISIYELIYELIKVWKLPYLTVALAHKLLRLADDRLLGATLLCNCTKTWTQGSYTITYKTLAHRHTYKTWPQDIGTYTHIQDIGT
jgi:hypothetical protein